MKKIIGLLVLMTIFLTSCKTKDTPISNNLKQNLEENKKKISLVPFIGTNEKLLYMLRDSLINRGFNVKIENYHTLPKEAYYPLTRRYRAGKILKYLNTLNFSTKILGITNKDISHTKGNVYDWSIMGMGYLSGKVCVVSTFRIKDINKRLPLIALHEIGHIYGLPHCNNKCLMLSPKPDYTVKNFCNECQLKLNNNSFSS